MRWFSTLLGGKGSQRESGWSKIGRLWYWGGEYDSTWDGQGEGGAGAGWKSWLKIMVRKTECFHGFVTQRGLGNLCEVTNMYQKFCFWRFIHFYIFLIHKQFLWHSEGFSPHFCKVWPGRGRPCLWLLPSPSTALKAVHLNIVDQLKIRNVILRDRCQGEGLGC